MYWRCAPARAFPLASFVLRQPCGIRGLACDLGEESSRITVKLEPREVSAEWGNLAFEGLFRIEAVRAGEKTPIDWSAEGLTGESAITFELSGAHLTREVSLDLFALTFSMDAPRTIEAPDVGSLIGLSIDSPWGGLVTIGDAHQPAGRTTVGVASNDVAIAPGVDLYGAQASLVTDRGERLASLGFGNTPIGSGVVQQMVFDGASTGAVTLTLERWEVLSQRGPTIDLGECP